LLVNLDKLKLTHALCNIMIISLAKPVQLFSVKRLCYYVERFIASVLDTVSFDLKRL